MKIKYLTLIILATLIFGNFFVSANENFTEAEKLIGEKVSCDNLSEEQLEEIGDYYMEQMHPGESHEYMDKMMGGEGSESLRAMHIQMAGEMYNLAKNCLEQSQLPIEQVKNPFAEKQLVI